MFIFFILFFLSFTKSFSSEINLKVTNITEAKGFIHVAVYDNPKSFPSNEKKYLGLKEKVEDVSEKIISITDLFSGEYAIAIYHDENGNNSFDTFLGLPKEKYGFSNNPTIFLNAPSFEESKFYVNNNDRKLIEIELR